jgi:hypothetical protein
VRAFEENLSTTAALRFQKSNSRVALLIAPPHANPDVTEHNKTPVRAVIAPTGVISSEYGQAVFPFRGGKLHYLSQRLCEFLKSHNLNPVIGKFFCSPTSSEVARQIKFQFAIGLVSTTLGTGNGVCLSAIAEKLPAGLMTPTKPIILAR